MKTIAPDKRVEKTIKKLEKALFELLKEKKTTDITIQELCEKASIHRSTFYDYFKSIDDLFEYFQNKYIQEFKKSVRNNYDHPENIYQFYVSLLEHIYQHQQIYYCLYNYNNVWMMDKTLSLAMQSLVPLNKEKRLTSKEIKLIKIYNSYGCNGIIREWINNDCKDPIEDIASCLYMCSTMNLHINKTFSN
ncbi:MAG: TetR/AcrR family transcriptional regulator [Traorella sp.]